VFAQQDCEHVSPKTEFQFPSPSLREHPFLNLEEAAALVGLKPPTLRRAIRCGELVYARPGRAYLVRYADLLAWLDAQLRRGGVKIGARALQPDADDIY
jgi:excisionase family DNA binding protein